MMDCARLILDPYFSDGCHREAKYLREARSLEHFG
jgi:hypothetical protein